MGNVWRNGAALVVGGCNGSKHASGRTEPWGLQTPPENSVQLLFSQGKPWAGIRPPTGGVKGHESCLGALGAGSK